MSWPLPQDFNEAIQSPHYNFSDLDLQRSQVVTNSLGIPLPCSGSFADVYQLRCPGGKRWAVKCFTREMPSLRERYAAISRHLDKAQLPFILDFTFLEHGIRVGRRWYPIVKMPWVEGLTLNEFVRRYADKPAMLSSLLQIWMRMAARLRQAGIAHADLQHANVLLAPGIVANALALKLVDYDGMFLPELAGSNSGEVGHTCYQHPQRLIERTYSLEVDRFPLLLIATALSCLKAGGKALWDKYDNGDNLLFREADLRAPVKSRLFYELLKLSEPQASHLVRETLDALKKRLEAVPLLEEVLPELHVSPVSKPTMPAMSKRTSAIKAPAASPTPVAQPAAQPIEANSSFPWDFVGKDQPRSRRRRKGTMTRWLWAVAGVGLAALVLTRISIVPVAENKTEKSKDETLIAQIQPEKSSLPFDDSSQGEPPKEKPRNENGQHNDELKGPPPVVPEEQEQQDADEPPAKEVAPDAKELQQIARFPVHEETFGPWQIEKGSLVVNHPRGNSSWPNIYFGEKDWRDYNFTVEVMRLKGASDCALWFRHTTRGNSYCVSLGKEGKLVTLQTVQNNRRSNIAPPREGPFIKNGFWYTLRVEVHGPRIRILVDDDLMFNEVDPTHPKGSVGLYVNSSKFAFRKIKVTNRDDEVRLQGLPDLPTEKKPSRGEGRRR